jgi:hypothetical protein
MPTVDDSIAQAAANATAAHLLAEAQIFDWAITALFYSALHEVQAYLAGLGPPPTTHRHREALIRESPQLASIENPYAALRVFSENARYECFRYSRDIFVELEAQAYQPIMQHLRAIRGGS